MGSCWRGEPYTGIAENAAMPPNPARSIGTSRRRALVRGLQLLGAGLLGRTAQAADAPQHMLRTWPAGKTVPPLALTDLDGKAWDLAKLKGQPVLLNFWATWCEPCRSEMPSLELLATRYEKAGLLVLAVNYKEATPAIRRFLQALPFSLPILLDRDGDATSAWTPRVFPTTVLIDRDGTPRQSVLGELDWTGAEARALVESLLARGR
jgi:thiol-disulfide isomerase/thioredoxin